MLISSGTNRTSAQLISVQNVCCLKLFFIYVKVMSIVKKNKETIA